MGDEAIMTAFGRDEEIYINIAPPPDTMDDSLTLGERVWKYAPGDMLTARRWVLWRQETRTNGDGTKKATKVPYQLNGARAESDNPQTWTDFTTAVATYEAHPEQFTGIGFVLGDGWWGVDVDRPTLMDPNPMNSVRNLGAYVETSVSGNGCHVIGYDPDLAFEHKQIPELTEDGAPVKDEDGHSVMTEFYAYPDKVGGRFFTVTGRQLPTLADDAATVARRVKAFNADLWWVKERRKKDRQKDQATAQADSATTDRQATSHATHDGDEVLSALDAIDPAGTTYNEWLAIGRELKARGYDVGVWDRWSKRDEARYHDDDCAKRWGGFPVTDDESKTIFRLANDAGWRWESGDGVKTKKDDGASATDDSKTDDGKAEEKKPPKPAWLRMEDYLAEGGPWDQERQKRQTIGLVGTGWEELDRAIGGGLTPELYLMGGAPGTGKTTIAWQLCDYVASQGWPAIYVCTEQGAYELACKSVARTAYLNNATDVHDDHPITALGLMQGYWPAKGRAMADEYLSHPTPRVIQCDYDESIESVSLKVAEAEKAIRQAGDERPVCVVIDYLQLLRSDAAGKNASEREITDAKVRALKAMQKNDGDPRIMIVLSAFSRDAYRDVTVTPPTMAAFKESGSIEYAAAVCIALWRFAGIKKKGDWLVEPDADEPGGSVIRARIVKNRYGRADRTVWMEHVKLFDYVKTHSYKEMQDRGLVAMDPDDEEGEE